MTRPPWIGVAAVGVVMCGGSSALGTAHVRLVQLAESDSVRFEVPVRALRCAGGHGFVLIGSEHGQGVLVWLRDSAATPGPGTYPLLARGDSTTSRGAIASVRYVASALGHGVTVDDGSAVLSGIAPRMALRVRGQGVEPMLSIHQDVDLDLVDVLLEADTASCRVQL